MSALAEATSTNMPEPIVFTDSAAAKVADLIAEEGNTDLKLRVFVQGGGCSGFQYKFDVERERATDDLALGREDATVLIDPVSLGFLTGSEIDYVDDLIGASFKINNPQAKSFCGCGTSFSL